jgi:hypothetical protein
MVVSPRAVRRNALTNGTAEPKKKPIPPIEADPNLNVDIQKGDKPPRK